MILEFLTSIREKSGNFVPMKSVLGTLANGHAPHVQLCITSSPTFTAQEDDVKLTELVSSSLAVDVRDVLNAWANQMSVEISFGNRLQVCAYLVSV